MTDLIERDEALRLIAEEQAKAKYGMEDCALYRASKIVRELPAANSWIPCSEKLPEKDKSYITYAETTKYCNYNEIPEESRINILYFNGEEWYDEECRYYNVTHYMPMPEPPESGAQDEAQP